MKVRIESEEDDCGYLYYQELSIDGRRVLSVGNLDECPEDATLSRSLVSCDDVLRFMKIAHEAGLRGEPLDIEHVVGGGA